jgi:membrane protease YdiL (CAAX protease family)
MSTPNPAMTLQEEIPHKSQVTELQLVTWDDFFPCHTDSAVEHSAPAPTANDLPLQKAPVDLGADNRPNTRALLEGITKTDSHSERGWLRLAEAVDTEEEQRFCLQQVLSINRHNALARRRLEALGPGFAESPLLHLAVAELEAGNAENARHLLHQVIQADPRSERGWLWLAEAVDSNEERRLCLQQVLSINRRNALARRRLEALTTGIARPKTTELESLVEIKAKPSVARDRLLGLRAALQKYSIPIAFIYLGVLTIAEALTTLIAPQSGLILYGAILLILLAHAALTWGYTSCRFLFTLSFAPLIRMISLFLPLAHFPLIYWYLIVSVPLFAAAFTALRTMRFSRKDIGLKLKKLPLQIPVIFTGLSLGYFEYRILQPNPLVQNFNLGELWLPVLILLVCTGFVEELIFRGMMQHAAVEQFGAFGGILYVATLFAVLHMGYHSLADVIFVFVVALFFGLVTSYTGSIIGVSLAHGLTNVILYLTMPFGANPFDLVSRLIHTP